MEDPDLFLTLFLLALFVLSFAMLSNMAIYMAGGL